MTRRIKNIVFDLGGVVVGYDPKDFLIRCFCNKKTEDYLYSLIFGSELWQKLDEGTVTREEANETFLKKARKDGYLFEAQTVLDDWKSMLKPKADTVALIKMLRQNGYHIYYLSNLAADVAVEFKRQPKFQRLFDGGVISSEEKLLKPDPAIFTRLLERCGLIASETLFCDDNKENAAAAAQAGILGVQFLGAKNFQKLLKGYGVRACPPKELQKQEKAVHTAHKEPKQKESIKKHFERAEKSAGEKKVKKPIVRKPAAESRKKPSVFDRKHREEDQDGLRE